MRLRRFWRGQSKRWKVLTVVVAAVIVYAAIGAFSNGGNQSSSESDDATPVLSRNGKWLAFSGDGISVGRLGAVAREITDPGKDDDVWPAWSPDGSRIVFARFAEDGTSRGLFVVNRDGSGLRRLTKRDDYAPSWSPDGETIAFTRSEGYLSLDDNVRVIDADGKNVRLLVRDASDPAWSPDGSKIAFVRGFLGGAIAILDLKTKRIEQVVPSKLAATAPAWSPDGRQIVFENSSDVPSGVPYSTGIPEIYVVNIDGSGLRRLTKDREAYDVAPTWTPGGRIVFASDRDGPVRLYVMNRDGTGLAAAP